MKERMTTAPVLSYPDPFLQYLLDTDIRDVGVVVVLLRVQDCEERVIAYYSKTLAPPEKN